MQEKLGSGLGPRRSFSLAPSDPQPETCYMGVLGATGHTSLGPSSGCSHTRSQGSGAFRGETRECSSQDHASPGEETLLSATGGWFQNSQMLLPSTDFSRAAKCQVLFKVPGTRQGTRQSPRAHGACCPSTSLGTARWQMSTRIVSVSHPSSPSPCQKNSQKLLL